MGGILKFSAIGDFYAVLGRTTALDTGWESSFVNVAGFTVWIKNRGDTEMYFCNISSNVANVDQTTKYWHYVSFAVDASVPAIAWPETLYSHVVHLSLSSERDNGNSSNSFTWTVELMTTFPTNCTDCIDLLCCWD